MRPLPARSASPSPTLLAALQAVVPAGGGVVEVGTTRSGCLEWLARLVGPGGAVVSLEPDAEELDARRRQAGALGGHVTVLGADDGSPAVVLGPDRPVHVVLVRADGAEPLVLDDLAEVLDRWRPTVLVDLWPDAADLAGDDPEAAITYYRSLGYAVDVLGSVDVGSASTPAEVVHHATRQPEGACTLLLRPVGTAPAERPRPLLRAEPAARVAARRAVDAVPFWFHSVDVGDGVRAPGHKTRSILAAEWQAMDLGDLDGRTVCDVGAWDGFFSFACEEAGAASVTALDEFVWRIDRTTGGWAEGDDLPGRAGFELAHRLRGSGVRPVVADIATLDPAVVGTFDEVLLLGVLYHLPDPLGGLRQAAAITGGRCTIETQAIVAPGDGDLRLWEFHPGDELNGDPTNWFVPTMAALRGACLAAGFGAVEVLQGPPPDPVGGQPLQYRAIVRATR